jgi:hypothetical protein
MHRLRASYHTRTHNCTAYLELKLVKDKINKICQNRVKRFKFNKRNMAHLPRLSSMESLRLSNITGGEA